MVRVGYTFREFYDGRSLASPGHWPVESQRFPTSNPWSSVKKRFQDFADGKGRLLLLGSSLADSG